MTDEISAELSWPQVHAFRLQRHHLDERAPRKDLAKVVGEIGGAQAQVMSAAELQIAVRAECTVADVREALWKDRTLVKTWLMRGTLHLTRAADLPLCTGALGKHWISVRPSWLKFWNISELELWKLVDDIGGALGGDPMTREQVIAAVADGRPERMREALKSGWGGMLKPAARNGRLCFGPSRGQNVTFVDPREWLDSWHDVDPDVAIVEMARRYLRVYGPSTKSDFARWWGPWPGVGNAAWAGIAPELVKVSVEGTKLDALRSDIATMKKAKIAQPVQLVPLFDPYLMGYARRDHMLERAHASKVSRTAGWISAVLLVEGRIAGTWTHTLAGTRLRVAISPFSRLPAKVLGEARERATEIGKALGATKIEVAVG